jgi:hypothetical protein
MSISKKDAQSLAVAYQAFCEAVDMQNLNKMKVWAWSLERAQDATGVTLRAPCDMQRLIENLERVSEAA